MTAGRGCNRTCPNLGLPGLQSCHLEVEEAEVQPQVREVEEVELPSQVRERGVEEEESDEALLKR